MDTQTTAAEPQHPYPVHAWNSSTSTAPPPSSSATASTAAATASPSTPAAVAAAAPAAALPAPLEGVSLPHSLSLSHIPDAAATPQPQQFHSLPDFLPFFLPQQSNIYHAQLLHYNKLISPTRGGGLQTPPLPPVVSAPHIQAAPRSRSSSKVSLKDTSAGKGNSNGGGHGNRSHQNSDKNRSVMTSKETGTSGKMAAKQNNKHNHDGESSRNLPRRPAPHRSDHSSQSHSSSVPSTPHQHARQFSFEDREPSPTATNNHSPRSAYSETSGLPSLRPLPPRLGGCKYETAQINSRRRIPYSVGSDPLERLDLKTVKNKLSEDDERKLANDMREVYDRLLPTDAVEQNRKKLVLKLEKIFNDEWPGHNIRVHLFGSSGNLLCSDDSDVDICIATSWRAMEDVCMIADLLAKKGMQKVVCISAAKVPIVKIWDPELGLACDMNVNNTLALENTRMVRTYVESDDRVRQLAMIIKYWTRRRIVNDAAFGGTLSSYTWICLIIAFLQLRSPPVLPSLHQLPHKLPKPDGTSSEFADDLKKISGFGKKNKSSTAELLFQFFRFYAHEFDFNKHVLSVRLGKYVTKQEKKWNYGINNQLCVEEPFNTGRNLGNTADEYSFRGLHLELRRAFDMISEGKFEEACEQYVFPKEEERVWSRPPQQPRPAMLRSSSQTHTGRGGRGNHRGGRHNTNSNGNFHRGGNSNRRASSSVPTSYDATTANSVFMQPINTPQDLWMQHQLQYQYAAQAQQDLMQQIAIQENMRLQYQQLYGQSPAFIQQQHQAMGQQRMPTTPGAGQQSQSQTPQPQSAERSRTNSFDNAPLTAPPRPDLYNIFGMPNFAHYFPPGVGFTYPSSPAATSSASQEFRRPLQRSTANADSERASNSAQRSHSQPASRSPSSALPTPTFFTNPAVNGIPAISTRNVNGTAMPNFMPDETDFDETPKAQTESPLSEEGKASGYFLSENSSPRQSQQQSSASIAFGDLNSQSSSPSRRRLSTEQLPQTILDRRMRRASRSPSPLGHSRAFSVGTSSAPLTSAPFPGSQNKPSSGPLVVNGSGLKTSVVASPKRPSETESIASEDSSMSYDNPLQINMDVGFSDAPRPQTLPEANPSLPNRPPVIANGTHPLLNAQHLPAGPLSDDASFRDRIDWLSRFYLPMLRQEAVPMTGSRLSPSTRQRLMSRQQHSGAIAPLDLAIAENRISNPIGPEMAHLSPVYETRTPSPTVVRKFDGSARERQNSVDVKGQTDEPKKSPKSPNSPKGDRVQNFAEAVKLSTQKAQKSTSQTQRVNGTRENGHIRGAKSESDGGWQKAGKGKKKASNGTAQQAHAEPLPKNESERKGG